jgi:hypothetical protein
MRAAVFVVFVVCVASSAVASPFAREDSIFPSFLETATTSGLNVSSLTVNAGPMKESKITLGTGAKAFTLSLHGDSGDFEVRHGGQRSFVINRQGNVEISGNLISMGAVRIDGRVNFMGVDQWMMAASENFNMGASGWSNDSVTVCGHPDKKILGGYGRFAGGEVWKTFVGLPPHKEVRLKANFHFIDSWGGETGYAKLEHRVVWTDSYDQAASSSGINLCGSAAPEGKYSQPIEVNIPHVCTGAANEVCALTVSFGSTLSLSPTEQSWGVSDVMIFVR